MSLSVLHIERLTFFSHSFLQNSSSSVRLAGELKCGKRSQSSRGPNTFARHCIYIFLNTRPALEINMFEYAFIYSIYQVVNSAQQCLIYHHLSVIGTYTPGLSDIGTYTPSLSDIGGNDNLPDSWRGPLEHLKRETSQNNLFRVIHVLLWVKGGFLRPCSPRSGGQKASGSAEE